MLSGFVSLQAEQVPDSYEAEGPDALDRTSTPPGSPEGCCRYTTALPNVHITHLVAGVHLISTILCPRHPDSASSDSEKDDSIGAVFTGSIFDQTSSEEREAGRQWGGGGIGSQRGRGRARGTLESGEDSADELEDSERSENSQKQDEADVGPEEPPTDGPSRRLLYLQVCSQVHLGVRQQLAATTCSQTW